MAQNLNSLNIVQVFQQMKNTFKIIKIEDKDNSYYTSRYLIMQFGSNSCVPLIF